MILLSNVGQFMHARSRSAVSMRVLMVATVQLSSAAAMGASRELRVRQRFAVQTGYRAHWCDLGYLTPLLNSASVLPCVQLRYLPS